MELLKKNIHTERIKSKALLQVPLEMDINVPDAKPDVARVVYDCGKIKVDEIKTGMNKIWVKGRLCCQILYRADGGGQTLAGMDGELPFMEEIYLEKIEGADRVICRSRIDDMRVHMINSRKLSIQSVITLEPRVEEGISEELCVELGHTGDGDRLEYRKKSLDFLETAVRKRDLLRIHEEVRLPAGMPDIGSVLWKNTEISNISFKAADEKLVITGELSIFVVYSEDSMDSAGSAGKTNWYEATVPFEGSVECANSREGMVADVSYDMGHEEITVREDSDGENRLIGAEVAIEMEIKLYGRESASIVADVYGVSCEVKAGIDSRQLRGLCAELDIDEKLVHIIKLEDSEPKILQICHCDARPRLQETQTIDGGIRLAGEVELQVLYAPNDEGMALCPVRAVLPFEVERELAGSDGAQAQQCSVSVLVPQQSLTLKDSSQLEWRGNLAIKVLAYSTKNEDILTELEIEPINADALEKLPGFAIYYAKQGDSLWQIGKKYYVGTDRIREVNGLADDEIKAGDKLLIVK